mmetsp:Transcript_1220/g.2502  ORF Transcript_1220/g.2502 Transcript_1220/m.2502 type:complete len:627 (+) Transcript_1220:66-1946(+)|eukprot:CAMPEP_0197624490 /NCGR_PEP_ID=MMETSP1338-20131121/4099_1 /TAXON_ID=43686 ORGANISM="Pelagodinium beii, Strain RCC1491" /NCGR_SAMPLE_ID=MMETSP1338 /ASSEMBLY_ACC=CAM_ASM_000754 /LENGTH=626 /DNA_ID=CAMNT_0043194629 /DNA_START=66 /DNA_END=1946 /DNA_ORIENTATION=+
MRQLLLFVALSGVLEAGGQVVDCSDEATDVLLLQVSGEVSLSTPSGRESVGAGLAPRLEPDVSSDGTDNYYHSDPDMNWFRSVKPRSTQPFTFHGPPSRFDGFRVMDFSGLSVRSLIDHDSSTPSAGVQKQPTGAERIRIQLRSAQIKSLVLFGVWLLYILGWYLHEQKPQPTSSTCEAPQLSRRNLIFLANLAAIAPASQDVYIPNMMAMAHDLNIDASMESLTLEANWVTCGICCVLVGMISDKYGRRPVLMACFCFYITGSLMGAVSQNLTFTIAARILQGMGEAAGMLPSAIFRDAIANVEVRTQVNLAYSIVGTAAIVCAPVLGGLIGSTFGWRSIFQVLTCWGIILFMYALVALPETNHRIVNPSILEQRIEENMSSSEHWHHVKEFARIFTSQRSPLALFILSTIFGTAIMSMLAAFPLVVESARGMSSSMCSLAMLVFALFVMVGACFALILKSYAGFKSADLISTGMSLFLASGFGFLLLQATTTKSSLPPTFLIMIPPCVLTFSGGIMNGAINSMYMEFFSEVAGTAAGFGISVQAFTTSAYAYLTVDATEKGGELKWMQCVGGLVLCAAFCWMLLMSAGYEDAKPAKPKKRKDSDTLVFNSGVFQRKTSVSYDSE